MDPYYRAAHTFSGGFELADTMPGLAPSAELAGQPMLYDCSPEQAKVLLGEQGALGAPTALTTLAIAACIKALGNPSELHMRIDTRVHMLKPGWLPAIPGWHCDSVPRPHGQPDPTLSAPHRRHAMVLFESRRNVAPTAFARVAVSVPPYDGCAPYWGHVHASVAHNLVGPARGYAEAGRVWLFGDDALHTATSCQNEGWRLFVRVRTHEDPPSGGLRRQTQVYSTHDGW